MKYKLYYRESNLDIDAFVKHQFKTEFTERSTLWSVKCMEYLLLDNEQALVLKLTFPHVILFQEHQRYVAQPFDPNDRT